MGMYIINVMINDQASFFSNISRIAISTAFRNRLRSAWTDTKQ